MTITETTDQSDPAREIELLTPAQVGRLVGRSGDWVSRRARAGQITYLRIGRGMRFRRDDVATYLDGSVVAPKAPDFGRVRRGQQ